MPEGKDFFLLLCLLGSLWISLPGCDDDPPADGDADGNGDADGDGDADADADADVDGDADGDGPVHIDETPGCDPLIGASCAYPFPSTFYLEDDPGTATGYRVALTKAALAGNHSDPDGYLERFNRADGFSRATPWLAIFPEATLDSASLPSLDDLSEGMSPAASVQVIDRETGDRYPLWAELDWNTDVAEEQTLIIRPMKGLALGRRVAIVITDALRNEDGSTPEAPAAFAALRDKNLTDSDIIEGRRDEFESLFTFLGEQGVRRERLLLAWEGVTFSDDFALGQIQPMLDIALAEYESVPMTERMATYRVTRCFSHDESDQEEFGCDARVSEDRPLSPYTWRRLFVRASIPSFLADDGLIHTDEDGQPILQGTYEADVVVNIPESLRRASAGSAPVLVFGHGLLRDPHRYISADVDIDGQMALSNELGAVMLGTRWLGLSGTEVIEATNMIFDPSTSFLLESKIRQGIINQLLMASFATGSLAEDPLFQASDGMGSIVNDHLLRYTGISLGGIFGTTLMTFSPHIQTGVLHVPGTGFVHMLSHSVEFIMFQEILSERIEDPRGQQLFLAMTQRVFDPGDPINYLEHIQDDPLTSLGPKNCLWQCALGDAEAMWYGCDMLVRTGGFPVVAPAVVDIYDTELLETPSPPNSRGMAQFDPQLGMPSLVGEDIRTGAHQMIRRNPEVQLQTLDFLDLDEPGRIVNHCDGPCVIDPVPEPEE